MPRTGTARDSRATAAAEGRHGPDPRGGAARVTKRDAPFPAR